MWRQYELWRGLKEKGCNWRNASGAKFWVHAFRVLCGLVLQQICILCKKPSRRVTKDACWHSGWQWFFRQPLPLLGIECVKGTLRQCTGELTEKTCQAGGWLAYNAVMCFCCPQAKTDVKVPPTTRHIILLLTLKSLRSVISTRWRKKRSRSPFHWRRPGFFFVSVPRDSEQPCG